MKRGGVNAPSLTAEILLCHALKCERPYLYAHPEQELREVEWLHFGRYLHERLNGNPTQYITKRQEFYGRAFCVSPDVLIPRPETELLVESVLREVHEGLVVDVGTGSGAIAVTLALESKCRVVATDLSGPALALAIQNAARHGAGILGLQMDLLHGFADGIFDAVVSNPPYVPVGDKDGIAAEVRDWEPHLALFGGTNGFDVYSKLIPEAWRVLKPGGLLAIEIGFGQSDSIVTMMNEWSALRAAPDLAGIPRVVLARKLFSPVG